MLGVCLTTPCLSLLNDELSLHYIPNASQSFGNLLALLAINLRPVTFPKDAEIWQMPDKDEKQK